MRKFIPDRIAPEGRPVFRLSLAGATDYEIGRQRGLELAEDLRRMWVWMDSLMRDEYGFPEALKARVADNLIEGQARTFPWVIEQISGMAESSSLALRDAVLINCYGLILANAGAWCTSIALRESEEGPLLGQNLDISTEDFYYAEEVRPVRTCATLANAMAGMCWCACGLNEAGLAVASSFLPAPGRREIPWNWDGTPFHFLPTLTLRECESTNEAVRFLQSLPAVIPSGGGYQLNLLDAGGETVVVDMVADRTVVRRCEKSLNFTTNSTPDEQFELWRLGKPGGYPDGIERAARIRREWAALRNRTPDRGWLTGLLGCPTGPGALCHTDKRGYSRLSLVISPVKRTVDISNGPPDRTPYEQLSLTE